MDEFDDFGAEIETADTLCEQLSTDAMESVRERIMFVSTSSKVFDDQKKC